MNESEKMDKEIKFMTDDDLRIFIGDLNKKFSKIYEQKDYLMFKKNAEKFFKFYKELQHKEYDLSKELSKYIHEQLKSRIFLGIGCELLLKSVYLKNDYLINCVNESKLPKGMRKPYKISEVPKECILTDKTCGIEYFLKNLHIFFEKVADSKSYITFIKKGMSIAKVWRDKDTHIGGGYHQEDLQNAMDIWNSIHNIYFSIFNEGIESFFPEKQNFRVESGKITFTK